MGVLPDNEIEHRSRWNADDRMVDPFCHSMKRPGRISYGVTSYGYDARLGDDVRLVGSWHPERKPTHIDPKRFDRLQLDPHQDAFPCRRMNMYRPSTIKRWIRPE